MKNSKSFTIFLAIAVLVALGGFILMNQQPTEEDVNLEVETNPEMEEITSDNAATVTATFVEAFLATAPSANESGAKEEALAMMSEGAKMRAVDPDGNPHLGVLFGVQDFPDEGYEIGEVVYEPNPATGDNEGIARVEVKLNYSGGPVTRTIVLSKGTGEWMVDAVVMD